MNVSYAVKGILEKVRTETLKHFDVLDIYIYDETLDFRGRASQWIAREGVFQQFEGEMAKDWIFIIWNRSSLQKSNYQNRPMEVSANMTDPNGYADSRTTMRMASLDVEFKIVTNNIGIAEQIEEHLYVNTGELTTFDADYAELGIMKCSAQPDSTTTFEKEDLNELGPVNSVGLQLNINFPVIMPMEMAYIIKEIDYTLYQDRGSDEPQILDEVIIT